jgi:tripartite-type tricarboxylate transporter receptor subunit TctC
MHMVKLPRRKFLHLAACAAALPAVSRAAHAQNYPTHVIRIIDPFPPGGPADVLARIVARSISETFGQSVIVENRPGGAGGALGGRFVASADPDGYTILISPVGALTITPSLYKLDYDPLKDLAPIAIVAQEPLVLVVNPEVPASSFSEFLAYAKSRPGKVNLASPGVGTLPHLLGELLQLRGNIKLTHVPYRGAAPAHIDLLAGQVQVMFDSSSALLPYVVAGSLRALMVTSNNRIAEIPSVPTAAEAGYPQLTAMLWHGLLAPAGTPAPIIQWLNSAVNEGLNAPEAQASLHQLGLESRAISPQEFKAFMAAEALKWAQFVAHAGIKGE